MSAPQTNPEKQRRRHRGPLIGITLVLIFVALIFVWWVLGEAAGSGGQDNSNVDVPGSAPLEETTPTTDPAPADQ
jgi:hypothetical protein